MINILVPQLGESVVEARVTRWLKKEGDRVEVGEPVVELETEKIDLEVGAEHSGVLTSIKHKEGDDVKVGEVLATVDETGAAAAPEAPPAAGPAPTSPEGAATPNRADLKVRPDVAKSPEPAASAPAAPPASAPLTAAADEPKATPTARRMARDHEVDIGALQGSGAAGRVTKQDVRNALGGEERPAAPAAPASATSASASPAAPPGEARIAPSGEADSRNTRRGGPSGPSEGSEAGSAPSRVAKPAPASGATIAPSRPAARAPGDRTEERVRMSKRRETIARRLVEAQHTAAMLTTFNELDMTALMALRDRRKEAFKKQYGVGLGIASFFVKASVTALRAFPQLNAEIQGTEIVLKHYYDIGMAVGAEGGLVVPVLRDADRMSFVDIERAIRDYAQRATDGTLTLEDLTGGTFTITNGGVFGSLLSTPILNPPQVGILGLHKIEDRPVVVNGQVVVRPMMYVALSYDHRIVDGREAVQFLVRIKELVEDPGHLLLES